MKDKFHAGSDVMVLQHGRLLPPVDHSDDQRQRVATVGDHAGQRVTSSEHCRRVRSDQDPLIGVRQPDHGTRIIHRTRLHDERRRRAGVQLAGRSVWTSSVRRQSRHLVNQLDTTSTTRRPSGSGSELVQRHSYVVAAVIDELSGTGERNVDQLPVCGASQLNGFLVLSPDKSHERHAVTRAQRLTPSKHNNNSSATAGLSRPWP